MARTTASVKVSQPRPACEAASCARTVSTELSSSTPCSAQRSRSPEGGTGVPVSSDTSLKMFWSEGGKGTPSPTEKQSPLACPGPW